MEREQQTKSRGKRATQAKKSLACSRLRDDGGKSFSNKKCEKRAGAGERQGATATAPFPKSCASYFRFARFNTFPPYYLRAWHRLRKVQLHRRLFRVMYRSNRSFNTSKLQPPRAFDFFENYCSNSPLPGPKCRSNAPH